MGEYAYYRGQRVKIGTCEDMLYLRWDQRSLVTKSETPLFDPEVLAVLRFRFPWPEEDSLEPGSFDEPFKGFRLYGFEQPEIEHGTVQFSARNGYLVSLACPEDGKEHGYTIHRNGYGGPAQLIGQAWRGGRLVGIAKCGGCEHAYRLEGGYEEAAAVAIRAQADRDLYRNGKGNASLHEIADRLLAGYAVTV